MNMQIQSGWIIYVKFKNGLLMEITKLFYFPSVLLAAYGLP